MLFNFFDERVALFFGHQNELTLLLCVLFRDGGIGQRVDHVVLRVPEHRAVQLGIRAEHVYVPELRAVSEEPVSFPHELRRQDDASELDTVHKRVVVEFHYRRGQPDLMKRAAARERRSADKVVALRQRDRGQARVDIGHRGAPCHAADRGLFDRPREYYLGYKF